jgi:hypothetical protein
MVKFGVAGVPCGSKPTSVTVAGMFATAQCQNPLGVGASASYVVTTKLLVPSGKPDQNSCGEAVVRVGAHEACLSCAGGGRLGFRVTPVTQTEIEVFVLRRAVADGDLDWEPRVVAAHHRFERTPRNEEGTAGAPTEAWLDTHTEFHNTLRDAALARDAGEAERLLRQLVAFSGMLEIGPALDPSRMPTS